MKEPTHPFVLVVWDDADSSSVEVITEENIDKYHKAAVMKTCGWLLRDDEKGVSLCNEVYYEDNTPRFRGHTYIPKSLVRSVTPFNIRSIRKKKPEPPQ